MSMKQPPLELSEEAAKAMGNMFGLMLRETIAVVGEKYAAYASEIVAAWAHAVGSLTPPPDISGD